MSQPNPKSRYVMGLVSASVVAAGVAAADQVDALTVVRVVEDFEQAVARARQRAGQGTVVVTGSVHTVGSTMSLLGIDPLAD